MQGDEEQVVAAFASWLDAAATGTLAALGVICSTAATTTGTAAHCLKASRKSHPLGRNSDVQAPAL
jgi:hypothetical protein